MLKIFKQINQSSQRLLPNRWDVIALSFALCLLILLAHAARQMNTPYQLGQVIPISLAPGCLPGYALRTVLRIACALVLSLLFTFTIGTWAAKSKYAGKLLIPLIDILQSVPVLAFLSISIVGFIRLFPNSLLGPECAAIFAIFTAQAWNMALSFYQSLCSVPAELIEAAEMFQLSSWQRFWRIEVPFALPGLLWNTMMSVSASWFSVVASEAISVSGQTIILPGIGSYIAEAIQHANGTAVIYAIMAMLLVILCYDQLLFRPLVKWSERFKAEAAEESSRSWFMDLLQRTYILRHIAIAITLGFDKWVNHAFFKTKPTQLRRINFKVQRRRDLCWNIAITFCVSAVLVILCRFIIHSVSIAELLHVLWLGALTSLRVVGIIILCSLIWVPIGVWIGLHPCSAEIIQPVAQFLAAFPSYLLFPIAVSAIIKWHLNAEVWVTLLMLLGTQWYILFNVIAGALALPKELNQATRNLGVKGWLWWRRFILPGIFPYYVTGAMTAVGGAWNTSIVAEVVHWGDTTIQATGLGAYITESTTLGHFTHLALGVGVMCLIVIFFNYVLWQPLYRLAVSRFQIN
jgi:NitT/TauT family transport system permease protein